MSALAYLFEYLEPELKSFEQVQQDCGPFYAKFACELWHKCGTLQERRHGLTSFLSRVTRRQLRPSWPASPAAPANTQSQETCCDANCHGPSVFLICSQDNLALSSSSLFRKCGFFIRSSVQASRLWACTFHMK